MSSMLVNAIVARTTRIVKARLKIEYVGDSRKYRILVIRQCLERSNRQDVGGGGSQISDLRSQIELTT